MLKNNIVCVKVKVSQFHDCCMIVSHFMSLLLKISPRPFTANTVWYSTYKLFLQSNSIKRKASCKTYCILKNLIYCPFSCLQYNKDYFLFLVMPPVHVLATASTQTLKRETLHGDCPW